MASAVTTRDSASSSPKKKGKSPKKVVKEATTEKQAQNHNGQASPPQPPPSSLSSSSSSSFSKLQFVLVVVVACLVAYISTGDGYHQIKQLYTIHVMPHLFTTSITKDIYTTTSQAATAAGTNANTEPLGANLEAVKAAGSDSSSNIKDKHIRPSLRRGITPTLPVTVVPDFPSRIIVIGDVHGDLGAFHRCLVIAGVVDEENNWAGGDSVVVQMGDIFDRGDEDLEISEWIHELEQQAVHAGGHVYSLLGNHEVMNIMGDHSMASKAAFLSFSHMKEVLADRLLELAPRLERIPEWARIRLVAMAPKGPVALFLASHSIALKVGDNLFVHGGLRPEHLMSENCDGFEGLECLETLNRYTHDWLLGKRPMPKKYLWDDESPLWSRHYSKPSGKEISKQATADLNKVLNVTGTSRMFIGHTPQVEKRGGAITGINAAAGGKIWRVDSGMTAMIAGNPEVLEISRSGEITIINIKGERLPAVDRTVGGAAAMAAATAAAA